MEKGNVRGREKVTREIHPTTKRNTSDPFEKTHYAGRSRYRGCK